MASVRAKTTDSIDHPTRRSRGILSRYRADLLAVGLLWFLCALFFWRLFSPVPDLRLHVVAGDFTNQFYPFRYFAAAEWGDGRIPLWNPYVFAGHPFLADVQTAVFYPLSLATALFGALWGELPRKALELEMALHYPLAALFSYLLGRQVLGNRLAALVTATAFTFSGFLTSYPAQQLAMLETAVWLPLVVLFIELAATRPASGVRYHVLAGVAYGLAVLAGHPQTAMFIAYAAGGYLILRSLTGSSAPAREKVARLVLGAAAFAIVGIGTSAVQLLPTVELVGQSTRADMTYEAAAYGYEWRALLAVLLPDLRGEKALYVGILPLALGALAVLRAVVPTLPGLPSSQGRSGSDTGERPLILGLAALAGLAVLLSVGGRTFLFRLLYLYAPGFDLFRDQERIIYLFAFAFSLLAGFGARDLLAALSPLPLLGRGGGGFRSGLALGGSAVGLAAALLALGRWRPDVFDPFGSLGSCALHLALVGLAAATVIALRPRVASARLYSLLLVAVVAADLFAVNLGNNLSPVKPDASPSVATLAPWIRQFPEEFRVRGRDDVVFPPNYAALWKLPTIAGDTPFEVKRVHDFLAAENGEWRRWQALNVKFQISRDEQPPADGLELAYEHGDVRVYRVVYSLPRVWAVRGYQVASSPDDALRRLLDPKLHPGDTVVLEEAPAAMIVAGERPDSRIVSYSPQRVEVRANGDGDALLILADTLYPGWKVYVDGEPARLLLANYVARAVELPAGEHNVVFAFEPSSFYVGAAVSALTVVSLFCALVLMLRRRTGERA